LFLPLTAKKCGQLWDCEHSITLRVVMQAGQSSSLLISIASGLRGFCWAALLT